MSVPVDLLAGSLDLLEKDSRRAGRRVSDVERPQSGAGHLLLLEQLDVLIPLDQVVIAVRQQQADGELSESLLGAARHTVRRSLRWGGVASGFRCVVALL